MERVLIARGIECDAAGMAAMLDRHGYETREVHDGESLLEAADTWRPHAAVIELALPGRPALEAGGELRTRFGGAIQLVGFTVPPAPHLENHALNAGFDHVVVDLKDAAEVLLAVSAPGMLLVRRAQSASLVYATTMMRHAVLCMEEHGALPEKGARLRNIAMLRRTIESIARCVEGTMIEGQRRSDLRLELLELEARFRDLVQRAP